MVSSRVDAEHAVDTRRETLVQRSRERALAVERCIQALEKRKLGWIRWVGIVERLDGLNDQVRVSDQDALVVHLGRCSVIVGLRIRKRTRLQVANLELGGERLIGGNLGKVAWEDEFGRGELVLGNDTAHWNDVARAFTNLLAIGQRNVLSEAKVDEIVRARQRPDLTGSGRFLTVLCETGHDHARVESQRGLGILVVVATVVPIVSSVVPVVSSVVLSAIISVVSVVSSISTVVSSVILASILTVVLASISTVVSVVLATVVSIVLATVVATVVSTVILATILTIVATILATVVSTVVLATVILTTILAILTIVATVVVIATITAIVGDAGVGRRSRLWWVDGGREKGSRSHDIGDSRNTIPTTRTTRSNICNTSSRRRGRRWWRGSRRLCLAVSGIGIVAAIGRIVLLLLTVMIVMVAEMVTLWRSPGRRLRGSIGNICRAGRRGTYRDVAATQISLIVLVLLHSAVVIVVIVVVSWAGGDGGWGTSECALCTCSGHGDSSSGCSDNGVVDRHGADLLLLVLLITGLASLETVGKCRAGEDEGDEGARKRKLHGR